MLATRVGRWFVSRASRASLALLSSLVVCAVTSSAASAQPGTGKVWIVYNRWEPTHGTVNSEPGTDNNQTWARHSSDKCATNGTG